MRSPVLAQQDLEWLFSAYGRELQSYLTRQVRCPETAADLAQETFLRMAQGAPDAGERNVRAYLFQIAHNLAIDHFRRQKRRQTVLVPPQDMHEHADDVPGAEQSTVGRQRLDTLARAMAELPPLTQEIFRRNRLQGMTYAEVADQLGISESSVQKHLARALAHGMRRLRED